MPAAPAASTFCPLTAKHVREPGALEVVAHARRRCPRRRPAPCRAPAPPIGGGRPALTPRSARRRTASSVPVDAVAPAAGEPHADRRSRTVRTPAAAQVGGVVEAAARAPRSREAAARPDLLADRHARERRAPRSQLDAFLERRPRPPRTGPVCRRLNAHAAHAVRVPLAADHVADQLDVSPRLPQQPRVVDLGERAQPASAPAGTSAGQRAGRAGMPRPHVTREGAPSAATPAAAETAGEREPAAQRSERDVTRVTSDLGAKRGEQRSPTRASGIRADDFSEESGRSNGSMRAGLGETSRPRSSARRPTWSSTGASRCTVHGRVPGP